MWQRSTVSCFRLGQNRPHIQRLLASTKENSRTLRQTPGSSVNPTVNPAKST